MDTNTIAIIVAIIASLPGIGAVIYNFKRAKPDALTTYIGMVNQQATRLAELENNQDEMRIELRILKKELADKEELIAEWRDGIRILLAQFAEMKTQPRWKPKTGPLKGK